ncbi:uncharacterized protein EHS24_006629 [Apiotrichum porosum]|uniref:Glycoside hydrolase 35 catalytic domain-containing protein n=1 Tax=Apiotrichum porosum TaxID=105984 RepID=A0A427Y1T3_9TREE|nr:uncharacterized protein EHS24_006629 [Apiotrichum porosum]RSH85041.1 hypothetical protein EHS24_006629 [Apiotrichum porosum]
MAPFLQALPHGGHELIVNGSPFLCRAGELQNSSFSSAVHMSSVWPDLVRLNLNTAFAAIGWDDIEPQEGTFVFEALDENIRQAREHGIKLALLWFGSHKNGHMNYAPSWVKTNPTRFPRCITHPAPDGQPKVNDYLSVFSSASVDADAKAFRALLAHLKQVDGEAGQETVIMVQVENEAGVLGDTRDRSAAAEEAFRSPVPSSFLDALDANRTSLNKHILGNFPLITKGLKKGVSWEATFGPGPLTDELFMAYHYALYMDKVAGAGKSAYSVPMYTNAALRATRHTARDGGTGGGAAPGIYPCGGPVDTVIDVYQLVAPNLDFVSPDIYFADYETMCQEYTHRGMTLVIPEQRRDEYGALRTWVAMGKYGALATAPFAIDTLPVEDVAFQRHYALLRDITPTLLAARRNGSPSTGFFFDAFAPGTEDPGSQKEVTLGEWNLLIERQPVFGHPAPGYGLIILTSADTFLLVGEGFQVTFNSASPNAVFTGLIHVVEKQVVDPETGALGSLRTLNGDETHCGKQAVMPCVKPDDGWYPIPTNIPSKTRIAECKVYSF